MPREYQYDFELRHFVYFREVAKLLHFRKAAESLGVAQPALSRQIAQLEKSLGVLLFSRSRRRVELTAAGKDLLDRVEPILLRLRRLPAELQSIAAGGTGILRVGFTGLAMATVLPAILRAFSQSHRKVRVELSESPTSAQVEALRTGRIACGFLHPHMLPPGFQTRPLLRERNGVVLAADHPAAKRKTLRLRDMAKVPFVLFPRHLNSSFYDRTLAAFTEAGVTPHIAEEVWPRANAVGLVRAGVGATLMCPSEARNLPNDVVFRVLTGPTPVSHLTLAWRDTADNPPALKAFLAAAQVT
ncbi:LysR family transcriptional regulator [Synoicihabitans lomoniglobus]|uniref:LysR family transcriptional regulator n=1 Tax=Synoicihabitans lomoniglobus TaxID=2909285 RepID=A0AAF0I5N2_9BACT|nr:LysR family transcriptional regulator [Opitutaceae bacterium LMO-M01]WED67453.1 LysR family transcriptional regulator [Opitutaceae bacterium LMO-M01]